MCKAKCQADAKGVFYSQVMDGLRLDGLTAGHRFELVPEERQARSFLALS